MRKKMCRKRRLLLETAATANAQTNVRGLIINPDFAERAVTPVELLCRRFRWFRKRLGLLLGDKLLLRAKMFANGCIHGSRNQLVEGAPNQRLGDRHFVAVVSQRFGILQDNL